MLPPAFNNLFQLMIFGRVIWTLTDIPWAPRHLLPVVNPAAFFPEYAFSFLGPQILANHNQTKGKGENYLNCLECTFVHSLVAAFIQNKVNSKQLRDSAVLVLNKKLYTKTHIHFERSRET